LSRPPVGRESMAHTAADPMVLLTVGKPAKE
jgi:hypothetical protein